MDKKTHKIADQSDNDDDFDDFPARKRNKKDTVIDGYSSDSEEAIDSDDNGDDDDTTKGHDNINKEVFNRENQIEETNSVNRNDDKDDTTETNIEAFNMNDEMNTGHFDKQGNYISNDKKYTNESDEERWIDEVKDVSSVAKAHQRQVSTMKKRDRDITKKRRNYMLDEALLRLLYCVSEDETVLEALARFNLLRKKATSDIQKETISNAIDLLTDLIDLIEKKGIENVFDLTRNLIKSHLEEELLSSDATDDFKDKIWSFKWINKSEKIQEYYSNYEMDYWKANYFKNRVVVKLKDDDDIPKNWLFVACINFM